jgi:hypothetical protein
LTKYNLDIKSPFVKNFEVHNDGVQGPVYIAIFFSFPTNIVDSYEKYPESVVTGLTKIGGILALVRIVTLALFYLHKYLFETHIKKTLSLTEEGEDDMENDS